MVQDKPADDSRPRLAVPLANEPILRLWIDTYTGTYGDACSLSIVDVPRSTVHLWDKGVADETIADYGLHYGISLDAIIMERTNWKALAHLLLMVVLALTLIMVFVGIGPFHG